MRRALRTALGRPLLAAVVALTATSVLAGAASATHGQPEKQLPYQGVQAGSATTFELASGFPFERSTFGGRCSVPSDAFSAWDETGTATHVGSFTTEFSHCSQLDLATGAGTFSDGRMTTTAANGDSWTGTYVGVTTAILPDGTATYTSEVTIAGGTGRFTGATGVISGSGVSHIDMTVTPWAATDAATFDGWIAYDASQEG